ncbi:MAG: tandem-95 repeat protein [Bacteroidetes bacterium]|nr:tandem-95 repeat protein [Bacteroidota bacterium]
MKQLIASILTGLVALPLIADSSPGYGPVIPTTEWISIWGKGVLVNGRPANPGTPIWVTDPQGVVCGYGAVKTPGTFGLIPVYRDDFTTPELDEGAEPGDVLTVWVAYERARTENGQTLVWTKNGETFEYRMMSGVIPTTEWVSFYGTNLLVNGVPAEVGSLVDVLDADGNLCGRTEVKQAGKYGLVSVYRDDPSTLLDEGAGPGEPLQFFVNGKRARSLNQTEPVWTGNGDVINLDISAGVLPTTVWQNFYGTILDGYGSPVPGGLTVEVLDSDWNLCGTGVTKEDGKFGIIPVYRDDPETPVDEGGNDGDFYLFLLDGQLLISFPRFIPSSGETKSQEIRLFHSTGMIPVKLKIVADINPALREVNEYGKKLEDFGGSGFVVDKNNIQEQVLFINGPVTGGYAEPWTPSSLGEMRMMSMMETSPNGPVDPTRWAIEYVRQVDVLDSTTFKLSLGGYDNEGVTGTEHKIYLTTDSLEVIRQVAFGSIDPARYRHWDFGAALPPVIENPIADARVSEDDDPFILADLSTVFFDQDLKEISVSTNRPDLLTPALDGSQIEVTLQPNQHGVALIMVTATDTTGLSATDTVSVTIDPVNDSPVVSQPVSDETIAEDADEAVIISDIRSGFSDPDGDDLTVTVDRLDSGINFRTEDQALYLTPESNFNGTVRFVLTATDGIQTVSDTLLVTVSPVNDAVIVENPAADKTIDEDAPESVLVSNVASVFYDVDTPSLMMGVSALDAGGTVKLLANQVLFTPQSDFNGQVRIRLSASDGDYSAADTLVVTVTPVNDAPVVIQPVSDSYVLSGKPERMVASLNGVFSDVDGDTLFYDTYSLDPDLLSVRLSESDIMAFSEAADTGWARVVVTAYDPTEASVSDTFLVEIRKGNQPPVLIGPVKDVIISEDDAAYRVVDSWKSVITDPDETANTISVISLDPGLTAWLNGEEVLVQPVPDTSGVFRVVMEMIDNEFSVADTFLVTVTPVNDAPVVQNPVSDKTIAEDSANQLVVSSVSAVFADIDGPGLSYDAQSLTPGLSAVISGNTVLVTPSSNLNGEFLVRLAGSDGQFTVADTFKVTVTPVNDAPVVQNPVSDKTIAEDSANQLVVSSVSAVFSDIDGPGLSYDVQSLTPGLSAVISGNTVLVTPSSNLNGEFLVRLAGSDGQFTVADTFKVTVTPVNDAPVRNLQLTDVSIDEEAINAPLGSVTGLFSDPDGDLLTYAVTSLNLTRLTVSLNTNQITGTAQPNQNGTVSVVVRATDPSLVSVTDTFLVTIRPVNDPPVVSSPVTDKVINEDSMNQLVVPSVSAVFSDIDGPQLSYIVQSLTPGLSAILSANTVLVTPDQNVNGDFLVTLSASDGQYTVIDTFKVVVTPVNDKPVRQNPLSDIRISEGDQSILAGLPEGVFSDPDGDILSYQVISADPGKLTATLSDNSLFVSTVGEANGSVSVVVYASDPSFETATDTFVVTIDPVNDPPFLQNPIGDKTIAEDSGTQMLLTDVSLFFDDSDSPNLTYEASSLKEGLIVELQSGGLKVTPALNINGVFQVELVASDDQYSVSDTFLVTVLPVNDQPGLVGHIPDGEVTEDQSTTQLADITSYFTDVDGDPLSYSALSQATARLIASVTDGKLSVTPLSNQTGPVSVIVRATDPSGSFVTDTLIVTILPVNDAPFVLNPASDRVFDEDSGPQITVNDLDLVFSDPDNSELSYSAVSLQPGLMVQVDGATVLSESGADANGRFEVVLTASDGQFTATDTLVILINPVNDKPVLRNLIQDASVSEDESDKVIAGLKDVFSDVDGDLLTLTVSSLDPGLLTVSLMENEVTGTTVPNQNGIARVVVTATDPLQISVTDTFLVTIRPVNDAPGLFSLLSPDSGLLTNGNQVAFSWTASTDPDEGEGDTVTYRIQLAADTLFTAPVLTANTRLLGYTFPDRLPNGVWNWRVLASDKSGVTTVSSPTRRVITADTQAPVIGAWVMKATDNGLGNNLSVLFRSAETFASSPSVSSVMNGSSLKDSVWVLDSQRNLRVIYLHDLDTGLLRITITGIDAVGNTGSLIKQARILRFAPGVRNRLALEKLIGSITIPEKGMSQEAWVALETNDPGTDYPVPDGWTMVSPVLVWNGNPSLQSKAELTLGYEPAQGWKSERHVSVYRWDEADSEWKWLGGEGRNGQVTIQLRKLETMSLFYNEEQPLLPDKLSLDQNYPNPFNPETTIPFNLPADATVTIQVFNLLGQQVTTLLDAEELPAGHHSVKWRAVGSQGMQASGVYFVRLTVDGQRLTRKLVLMK